MVLFSTSVSLVYPIVASYKSFETYFGLSNNIASSNMNIAGFNVPINSLLKRATGESTTSIGHEEKLLHYQLLTLQKWFIYWIVYASIQAVESILPLAYIIPGYSLLKLGFSIWLILPIATNFNFKFNQAQIENRSTADFDNEFIKFTQEGCGLIYFQYIRPWLDGELSILSKLPFDINTLQSVATKNFGKLSFLSTYIGTGVINSNDDNNKKNSNIFDSNSESINANDSDVVSNIFNSMKSFIPTNAYFVQTESSKDIQSDSSANVEDEYDVIDKPASNTHESENDIKQRKTTDDVAHATMTSDEQPSSPVAKKGWFW